MNQNSASKEKDTLKNFFTTFYKDQITELLQLNNFETVYRIPIDTILLQDFNPQFFTAIINSTEEFLAEARDAFVDAQIEVGEELFNDLKENTMNISSFDGEPDNSPQVYVKELVTIHLEQFPCN